jgi:hypothetical protein
MGACPKHLGHHLGLQGGAEWMCLVQMHWCGTATICTRSCLGCCPCNTCCTVRSANKNRFQKVPPQSGRCTGNLGVNSCCKVLVAAHCAAQNAKVDDVQGPEHHEAKLTKARCVAEPSCDGPCTAHGHRMPSMCCKDCTALLNGPPSSLVQLVAPTFLAASESSA